MMADQRAVQEVEVTETEFRFQIIDRDQFAERVESPTWAEQAAATIVDDATVSMGRHAASGTLEIERVTIPRTPTRGEADARKLAISIVDAIRAD